MNRMKVIDFGTTVQGVRLKGDRKNPEPESFRVAFPGGDVDVVRTTDGEYWVHVRVNHPEDGAEPEREFGRLVDTVELRGHGAHTSAIEDFRHPDLYHMAVRITKRENR